MSQLDRIALRVVRKELLVFAEVVVLDQVICCAEDCLGAAVILLETHHLDLGKIFFETQDVPDIGPAPTENRLIRITGSGQVRVIMAQCA